MHARVTAGETFDLSARFEVCPAGGGNAQITPTTAVLPPGVLFTFTAQTTPSGLPLTWSVNDQRGGSDVLGHIAALPTAPGVVNPSAGTYFAPAAFPPGAEPIRPGFTTASGGNSPDGGASAACLLGAQALVRLEVLDLNPVVIEFRESGVTDHLVVTARFSDGTSEDITRLATTRYASGNSSVVSVSATGVLTSGSVGDATIEVSDTRAQVPVRGYLRVHSRSRLEPVFRPDRLVSALPGERLPMHLFLKPKRGPNAGALSAVKLPHPDLEFTVASGEGNVSESGNLPASSSVAAALDLAGRQVVIGDKTGTVTFGARYKSDNTTATLTVEVVGLIATRLACHGLSNAACGEGANGVLVDKAASEAIISPVPEHPLDVVSLTLILRAPPDLRYMHSAVPSRHAGAGTVRCEGHLRNGGALHRRGRTDHLRGDRFLLQHGLHIQMPHRSHRLPI